MPIYEYACQSCGERFQELKSMSSRLAAPACVTCGSHATALAVSVPGKVGVGADEGGGPSLYAGPSRYCGGGSCVH